MRMHQLLIFTAALVPNSAHSPVERALSLDILSFVAFWRVEAYPFDHRIL